VKHHGTKREDEETRIARAGGFEPGCDGGVSDGIYGGFKKTSRFDSFVKWVFSKKIKWKVDLEKKKKKLKITK